MTGMTRRSAIGTIGAIAAAGLIPPARAQTPVTIKIAYPAWDTTCAASRRDRHLRGL